MNLKNLDTTFQIRLIYYDTAIETSRSQQRRIKYLRTVCCCKNK